MGVLDDAIREHLDLKRRRGGDPTEIERAERDALGPVRRGPVEPQDDEPSAQRAVAYDQHDEDWNGPALPEDRFEQLYEDDDHELGYEHDERLDDRLVGAPGDHGVAPDHHDFDDGGELFDEQELAGRASAHRTPSPDEAFGQLPPPVDDLSLERGVDSPDTGASPGRRPLDPLDRSEHAPLRRSLPQELSGETAEYNVEQEFEHEPPVAGHPPEAEGEDVLEATPEFLEDTPDHDRLWFEQRPPKDFDFNG